MENVSKAIGDKCGIPNYSIQSSIVETSRLLDIPVLQVCTTVLEEMAAYKIKVISWNCLADIWYGDRGNAARKRFHRVLRTLQRLIETYTPDVIMLQEITRVSYEALRSERLLKEYISNVSYHSKDYWHSQLKLPYQPNGTCIFVKKKLQPVFSSFSLGGGNFDSTVEIVISSDHKRIRVHISNVHLNDKDRGIRKREVSKILKLVDPDITYIIGGDLNSQPSDPIHPFLKADGFETVCFGKCNIDYIYAKKGNGLRYMIITPLTIGNLPKDVETLISETGSDHPPVGAEIFLF